jgi:hypothetical protein
MPSRLTKKQRALVAELREMRDLMQLDFEDIGTTALEDRTTALLVMRNKLVRGHVVVWYTLIDEFLTNRVCRFFFGKKRSFPALWRTKRFTFFNYYVIEQMSLLPKLRLVKAASGIPKGIAADIERLNMLRNGLAHSFFPENLRSAKPLWKGKNVFGLDGFKQLHADAHKIFAHFREDEDWY